MFWRQLGLCCLGVAGCLAQQYEIGGNAGGAFAKNASVTNAAASATAGLGTGFSFGGWIGHRMYPNFSGEVRYMYMKQDLTLSAPNASPSFKGQGHAVHYDFLMHPSSTRSKVMPFVAVGGGMKYYRGTGTEAAYQPGSSYAYLTKTQQWEPLISVGGGVRMQIAPRVYLRAEVRDYITPFPNKVITPAGNAKVSGWLHDFAPMVGISFGF
jgi:hypothetical protein